MSTLEPMKINSLMAKGNELQDTAAPIVRITGHAQSAIDHVMEKRQGFVQRLFPDAGTRAAIQGELALIKDEFAFRRRALEKVRETQIQSLTEHCNQYLVQEKAEIRQATATFLLQKKLELEKNLDSISEEFFTRMEIKMREVEAIQNPILKQVRETQLEKSIADFVELQNHLVDQFQRIISEGV
ncbi:hypothetical protein [Planktothrix mougeotii]|uniref:Uncharacterized protein n=1 Tax=Planktothrix mougeotii LEGE 06226 TaxID=1828728 RepID=A0ABR9UK25_9CYAN|nr:hypothetical protein [Planktothrix mougeotii]MBE9146494.1 hypothetical protein [Planktothrix mougeotii LEGE 06226]